jgi:hypothetical protein
MEADQQVHRLRVQDVPSRSLDAHQRLHQQQIGRVHQGGSVQHDPIGDLLGDTKPDPIYRNRGDRAPRHPVYVTHV